MKRLVRVDEEGNAADNKKSKSSADDADEVTLF